MPNTFYNVAPRYTCGSPAMVDRKTAEHVMREEREAYQSASEGTWGDEWKAKAEKLGLAGIVVQRTNYANHHLELDMITDTRTDSRDAARALRNANRAKGRDCFGAPINASRALSLLETVPGIHDTEQNSGMTYAELLFIAKARFGI